MSDRARSSVRTETRDGSGSTDEAPEATPAPAAAQAPAAAPAARSGASSAHSTADRAASPAAEGQQGPPDDATVAATPENAPTRGEQPAASPAPPAAHPVTPLGPTAPSARAAADGARPVTSPAPPVPTSAGRSAAPAPLDATQAVPLPAGGARPVDPASRPPAARPAEPNRAADAGRSDGDAAARAGGGKARGVSRGPRRARLQLRHIDTWSALKISLVVSIALFFVWMVAVGILYGVLGGLGVFESLNGLIGQLSSSSGNDVAGNVISAKVILGGAAVIGAVNIVLLTALCTVAAFVYNLCSDLVGGLEVTLAERD